MPSLRPGVRDDDAMTDRVASGGGSADFLPLADPDFDVTSTAVDAARDENWWVRTSYGFAVLRHAEGAELLRDRRFRQGNAQWPPRIEAALTGLTAYCEAVIDARASDPRDDLVSTMVRAHDDDRLDRRELAVAMVFLAFAGMETTRNQLGLAVQTLLGHPGQWELLGQRPDLGAGAVEEVMRVNPTVTWITREAVDDVDFHGLRVPAGTVVQVLSHATGTDPSAMPDPTFDITATRPPHLGFGAGAHHCLGHYVARVDMAVALPMLAARLRHARPDGPGQWLPMSGNTGALRFPLTFTPSNPADHPQPLLNRDGAAVDDAKTP